jgi:hypothetical protein
VIPTKSVEIRLIELLLNSTRRNRWTKYLPEFDSHQGRPLFGLDGEPEKFREGVRKK